MVIQRAAAAELSVGGIPTVSADDLDWIGNVVWIRLGISVSSSSIGGPPDGALPALSGDDPAGAVSAGSRCDDRGGGIPGTNASHDYRPRDSTHGVNV